MAGPLWPSESRLARVAMLVLPWIAEDLWCDVGRTLGRNDWMSRCSSSLIPIIRSCPRPVKGQLAAARSKGFGTRDL